MPIHLSFDELLAFTDAERAKWNLWIRAQPPAILIAPFQYQGQFSTVWNLLDHLFVVERRHLQRLRSEYPLPDSTGIAEGDWDQLWKWAVETRRALMVVAAGLNEEDGGRVRQVQLPGGWADVTPRKLLFHVLFHEIRHWAQVALALRNAGYQPPGEHDLVFGSVLRLCWSGRSVRRWSFRTFTTRHSHNNCAQPYVAVAHAALCRNRAERPRSPLAPQKTTQHYRRSGDCLPRECSYGSHSGRPLSACGAPGTPSSSRHPGGIRARSGR